MSSRSCCSGIAFFFMMLQAAPVYGQANGYPHSGNYNTGPPSNHPSFSAKTREKFHMMIVSHAIMACLAWAFFIPLGGILLRLNLRSPWILRIHMILQMTSYFAYVASVGLGIYLFQKLSGSFFDMWKDPHGPLGIAILAMGFIEPVLGWVHHKIFKSRMAALKASQDSKAPGRTAPGHVHLWMGRLLIVLGIINGGLGIRLTARVGYQHKNITRNASIGYGVGTGVMFLLYAISVIIFEIRKAGAQTSSVAVHRSGMTMSQHGKSALVSVSVAFSESDEHLKKIH
jgi:H+/Cl- antiporter ClcA